MRQSPWLGVDWDAHRHRAVVDGSSVEYVDIGSGPGPPIVFVHGLGAAWQSWLEALPHFARSHRCVALSLAGFGASDPVDGEVSIERYARSVCELMEQLELGPAVLVGNSMGGFIALELALRRPELVERLVLVSPAVFWQEYRKARPLVALAGRTGGIVERVEPLLSGRPRLRSLALSLGGFAAYADMPAELQREVLLTSRRTPGYLPALRALASYPLREELHRIRCPALIVWGTKDPLVGVRHADELAELLPDAEVTIHEGVGHVVMLEAPERFNAEVEAFLRRASARGD